MEKSTILVSDSIVDTIDMGQFYENPEAASIIATLWLENGLITSKVYRIKLSGTKMRIGFFCNGDSIGTFMLSKKAKSISFHKEGSQDSIGDYDNLEIVLRSIRTSSPGIPAGCYDCEIVFDLLNM
tara:strand:+ start:22587 stop:22964 length:378 start_codon:yes stop_codon:yes gene_type:complete